MTEVRNKLTDMERNIDFVVPMVFPQDAEWQRSFNRYHGGEALTNVRFRSWNTEELLIRCVLRFMPWVRTIHILLATESQLQPWMTRYPKVHVVYHRQFIPAKRLPCFASPCIEMFLHRIPGLAEQFVYANDDMFPLSPLSPTDFFREGKACVEVKEKKFGGTLNIFERKCLYQENMIAKPFGKHCARTWLYTGHTFAPVLKSVCEKVWESHGREIERWLSPLSRTEHSFNHYIYLLYEYFAGLTVNHAPRHQYAGESTSEDLLPLLIAEKDAGVVCLNDNERIKDWKHRAEVVRKAIGDKLGDTNEDIEDIEAIDTIEPKEKRTVCIVHYNTPKLTQYAIRSLLKHTDVQRVVVFDNSNQLPFMMKNRQFVADNPCIEVIDNTRGQIIDFEAFLNGYSDREPSPGNNYGSAKHCRSVQWLMENIDEPFVLMDSDVLIRRDISTFWQHPECAWVGEIGENVRERFGYDIQKLQPFLCFLNTPLLKEHGISYFNGEYMWNLTSLAPNHRYDTGAWLCRAVREAKLPTYELPIGDYIYHLGHASWRNRNPMEWAWARRECWE